MKRILIAGSNGQVGWELAKILSPAANVIALDRAGFDLDNPAMMQEAIASIRPDIIINAAAYTAVDKAESDEAAASKINAEAPGVIAEAANKIGAWVVHYSTDYVFDGSSTAPYVESDRVHPLNVYGKTKLEGEKAVREGAPDHLILRTSWVYGSRGKNFLLTMLRLGAEKECLRIVDDQIGAPTWSRSIADATAKLLLGRRGRDIPSGVYHLTCGGSTTWHGFAEEIFLTASTLAAYPAPRLEPIPASGYPLPAARPKHSVLSNKKLKETFGVELPDWKEALHACMKEINWSALPHRQ